MKENDPLDDFLSSFNLKEQPLTDHKPIDLPAPAPTIKPGWVSKGERITIGNLTIEGGFFYFGNIDQGKYRYNITNPYSYDIEESLVDDHLPYYHTSYVFGSQDVSNKNSYFEMSSTERYGYLYWLSSDRRSVNVPASFLRLYLCGFERRIHNEFDLIDEDEWSEIFIELTDFTGFIRDLYNHSKNIPYYMWMFQYCQHLLHYVFIVKQRIVGKLASRNKSLFALNNITIISYNLAIANYKNTPLDADSAFICAFLKNKNSYDSVLVSHLNEVHDIFVEKFNSQHKDGFYLDFHNLDKLRIHLRSTSKTVKVNTKIITGLFDPFNCMAFELILEKIFIESVKSIMPFRNYLNRNLGAFEPFKVITLLPYEVKRNPIKNQILHDFSIFADSCIAFNGGIVPFSEIWSFSKTDLPSKFSTLCKTQISSLLEQSGYAILPSPLFGMNYESTSDCVIFEYDYSNKDMADIAECDLTVIRLCVMVVDNLSVPNDKVVSFISDYIDESSELKSKNKSILKKYVSLAVKEKAEFDSFTKITKRAASKLTPTEIDLTRDIIQSISLKLCGLNTETIKALESIYKMLGLGVSKVSFDIHSKATGSNLATESNNNENSFVLDQEVLKKQEMDTKGVQSLLSSIFVEEEDDSANSSILPVQVDDENPWCTGLSSSLKGLLLDLSENASWQLNDAESLSKKHGVILSGAIESINDWSFDLVDDPVIEEDSDLVIDLNIIQKLKQLVR